MTREYRSPEEIDIKILQFLIKNGGSATRYQLRDCVHIDYRTLSRHLSAIGKKGLVEMQEEKRKLRCGSPGRRLLSDNPATIILQIVKITDEGRMFFNNTTINQHEAAEEGRQHIIKTNIGVRDIGRAVEVQGN